MNPTCPRLFGSSDNFLLQKPLLPIAFLLQKHCYFYCSKIFKILNINEINETWGNQLKIMNYELRKSWRESNASNFLLSFVTSCRVKPGMTASLNIAKINLRFLLFWPDNSLLSPDICQGVTCKIFRINMLKNEKTYITGQNAGKDFFENLSS